MTAQLVGRADAATRIDSITLHYDQSGFPSPAQDFDTEQVNLNDVIIGSSPHSTYLFKITGSGIRGALENAYVVVSCHLKPRLGCLVLAVLEGEFKLRRLFSNNDKLYLGTDRKNDPAVLLTDWNHQIWGPVSHIINFVM